MLLAGTAAASAQPPATPSARLPLSIDWQQTSLPEDRSHASWLTTHLRNSQELLAKQGQPFLPAALPIRIRNRVAYRTYDGLRVVDLNEKPDSELRHLWSFTDGGLTTLLHDPGRKGTLDGLKLTYERMGPHGVLVEHSINGSLTTDGDRLFLIDDLLLPPFNFAGAQGALLRSGPLRHLAGRTTLKAYHLDSMKLVWELGGDKTGVPELDDLRGSCFLGPPLAHDGKLYVLTERAQQIRLSCLRLRDRIGAQQAALPEMLWQLPVAKTAESIVLHPARRTRAVHLLVAGGLLLCPTNAGAFIAVDLHERRVAWSYMYRPGAPVADMANGLRPSPPLVTDGKVLFAAPDDGTIHRLDLRGGNLLWKVARGDALQIVGTFGDKVLLLGPTGCRALSLADGKRLWQTVAGIPSGQGVAMGPFCYLLPLQAGARTRRPEICAVHLDTGAVLGRVALPPGEVPGNLVWHGDGLLSQNATGVTAYHAVSLVLRPESAVPGQQELEGLWSDLASDAGQARNLARVMLGAFGSHSVQFLGTRLKPVPYDHKQVKRAIGELGDDNFNARETASRELTRLGELAESDLREALKEKPNLDMSRRIEGLLARIEEQRRDLPLDVHRQIQAVGVLEIVGSPEARHALEKLADGAPAATQTRSAKAALERLNRQPQRP